MLLMEALHLVPMKRKVGVFRLPGSPERFTFHTSFPSLPLTMDHWITELAELPALTRWVLPVGTNDHTEVELVFTIQSRHARALNWAGADPPEMFANIPYPWLIRSIQVPTLIGLRSIFEPNP